MLQIKQRKHETGRETRTTATTDTGNLKAGTKEIILRDGSSGSEIADDEGFDSRLKFIPRNQARKNNQRVSRIDHFFEGLPIQILIDHDAKSPSF
jgi:hypothetical protein